MPSKIQIYPFQIIGAKFIVDNKRALLGDEMGMFKSSQAIFAKSRMEYEKKRDVKTLIVCPNSVKEHWVNEFDKWYYKKDKTKTTVLESGQFNELINGADKADAVIINHELMSRLGRNHDDRLEKLKELGFEYVIIDEVHNEKNPLALRSNTTKQITDKSEYVALLSGTPVPNSPLDIYMLMSYLEPEKYKITPQIKRRIFQTFYAMYKNNPKFFKSMLHQRMLRRETKDYIEGHVPEIEMHDVEIPLDNDHRKVYEEIHSNDDMPLSTKFRQLEKVLLDPSLANSEFIEDESLRGLIGKIESSKYRKLDELVKEEIGRGGKVLIYSPHFKVGVTHKLKERYAAYGAQVIDGDVSAYKGSSKESDREKIRKMFQTDSNTRVLIATTTMNEGVDLTAATAIVNLNLPYTPSQLSQAIRRSARYGEIKKDKVRVYNLIATFPNKEIPTLDEGMRQLLKDKERVIDFMMKSYMITKEDIEELKDPYKTKPIKNVITSPMKVVFDHFFTFRRRSGEGIYKFLEENPEIAKTVPAYYLMQWEYSLPGSTARVYSRVINALEKVENLERKIDLAGGPNILSFILNEPTVTTDIDIYMLKQGKSIKHADTESIKSILHQNPVRSSYFDLALLSMAYQMTRPIVKKKVDGKKVILKEREQVLREASRVLRKDGYFILTMPYSCVSPDDMPKFYDGLRKLGLDVVPELSGYIEGIRPAKRTSGARFKIFMVTARKQGDATSEELSPEYFTFFMDRQKYDRGRKKAEWQTYSSRFPRDLTIYGSDNSPKELNDAISDYIKRSRLM